MAVNIFCTTIEAICNAERALGSLSSANAADYNCIRILGARLTILTVRCWATSSSIVYTARNIPASQALLENYALETPLSLARQTVGFLLQQYALCFPAVL